MQLKFQVPWFWPKHFGKRLKLIWNISKFNQHHFIVIILDLVGKEKLYYRSFDRCALTNLRNSRNKVRGRNCAVRFFCAKTLQNVYLAILCGTFPTRSWLIYKTSGMQRAKSNLFNWKLLREKMYTLWINSNLWNKYYLIVTEMGLQTTRMVVIFKRFQHPENKSSVNCSLLKRFETSAL